MEPKRKVHEFANDQALVEQLRRLPTPVVPEGLEDRLIAGIPRPVSTKTQLRQWKVLAALSAVAAAVVILAFLSQLDHLTKGTRTGSANKSREVVAARPAPSLDPKETDVCNVLPPLGDWH
jgi:hypothetical protein